MTSCARCGQNLSYPVFVNNLPYGIDCAAKILGLTKLPYWFNENNSIDYYIQKRNHEDLQKENLDSHNTYTQITKDCWAEYYDLSKAFVNFRNCQNDWGMNFITSICSQLGFGNCLQTEETLFPTYELAIANWKDYMGSFPYKTKKPKSISELSEKQKNILYKYL